MKRQYIAATEEFNTCEKHVCAPFLRKEFIADKTEKDRAVIEISAVGFYRLFLNGKEITKGCLAPYISNPDDIVYYDLYEVGDLLCGQNELRILLGNGFSNSLDSNVWSFESAPFRCAPKVYAQLSIDGKRAIATDESFEVYDSPVTFDDYRCGEFYDARKEGVKSNVRAALPAREPKGEYRLCKAHPVRECETIAPVSVHKSGDGWLYDFGQNNTGVCRLKITAREGQKISLTHGEIVQNGTLDIRNIIFDRTRKEYAQRDEYICKAGAQEWQPGFTYHGFRYVYAEGLDDAQATKDLLTFVVLRSAFGHCGNFECGDKIIDTIQQCTLRSDTSCFQYFPTDCPQREKNGWTADAALSSEQMLYNFDCADSLREWLHNIRKAQTDSGMLPGIVPTAGWGFEWGNGPAWDSVLTELPYQIFRFTGNRDVLAENADAIDLYFGYLRTKINESGLLSFGLGDWCEAATTQENFYRTSLEVTDTLTAVSLCLKTEQMFGELKRDCKHIADLRESLTAAFRKKYVRGGALTEETQTSYSMALMLGMFGETDGADAYIRFKQLIAEDGGVMRVGVIGQKYLFPLLFERGDEELAFDLIKGPKFPSYGYWADHGFTTLAESFLEIDEDKFPRETVRKDGGERFTSLNHHFWGSVSGLFYEHVAGLKITAANRAVVQPKFVPQLDHARASYGIDGREVSVEWNRAGDKIELCVCSCGYELDFRLPPDCKCVTKTEDVAGGVVKIFCHLRAPIFSVT